jgi:hypothetical protein
MKFPNNLRQDADANARRRETDSFGSSTDLPRAARTASNIFKKG